MTKIFYDAFAKIQKYKIQVFLKLHLFHSFNHIPHTHMFAFQTSIEVKRGLFMYMVVHFFLDGTSNLGLVDGNHAIVLDILIKLCP